MITTEKMNTRGRSPKYSHNRTQRSIFSPFAIFSIKADSENMTSFSHLLRTMMAFLVCLPSLPLLFPFPICSSPPTPPTSHFLSHFLPIPSVASPQVVTASHPSQSAGGSRVLWPLSLLKMLTQIRAPRLNFPPAPPNKMPLGIYQ